MCQIAYLIAETCPATERMLLEINTQEIYSLVDTTTTSPHTGVNIFL